MLYNNNLCVYLAPLVSNLGKFMSDVNEFMNQSNMKRSTFTSIVHAFVHSRLDYCKSLLIGIIKVNLFPLQSVPYAADRLITRPFRLQYSFIHSFIHSV